VLIIGCLGQIGTELSEKLNTLIGAENVVLSDVSTPPSRFFKQTNDNNRNPFYYLNVVNDKKKLNRIVEQHKITTIIHNAAFLSATAEKNVEDASELNTIGLHNVLSVAADHSSTNHNNHTTTNHTNQQQQQMKVFVPSSIAAFGPTTPLEFVPDVTIQRPTTVYGIGKVYAELMGEYYALKKHVDFRSLRYPGIISWKSPPGGGTTDYAVWMFYYALRNEPYECYLKPDQPLPMMYMPDCIKATVDFLFHVDSQLLDQKSQRTYNVTSFSFTPRQLEQAIKKYIPGFTVTYKPDFRQGIAESWPRVFDDSHARSDWNWTVEYDLDYMVRDMIENLRPIIEKQNK